MFVRETMSPTLLGGRNPDPSIRSTSIMMVTEMTLTLDAKATLYNGHQVSMYIVVTLVFLLLAI